MTELAYGQETAQAVLDQIRMHPETHDQTIFHASTQCGTTHCVAGWAEKVHGLITQEGKLFLLSSKAPLRMYRDTCLGLHAAVGAVLLMLNEYDAEKLFCRTDDHQALHALEYLAKGDAIDWEAVHGREVPSSR